MPSCGHQTWTNLPLGTSTSKDLLCQNCDVITCLVSYDVGKMGRREERRKNTFNHPIGGEHIICYAWQKGPETLILTSGWSKERKNRSCLREAILYLKMKKVSNASSLTLRLLHWVETGGLFDLAFRLGPILARTPADQSLHRWGCFFSLCVCESFLYCFFILIWGCLISQKGIRSIKLWQSKETVEFYREMIFWIKLNINL